VVEETTPVMTSVLNGYMARLFLARLLVVLFGLAALMTLVDLLANSDEIIESSEDVAAALGRYVVLRLPAILSQTIPMAVLLAALILLAGLARHSELAALFGSGLSHFRVIVMLLPVVLLTAALQFVIEDRLVPPTSDRLRAWGIGDYKHTAGTDRRDMTWIRQGGNFVRIGRTDVAQDRIFEVTIFSRNAEGRLIEKVTAASATYVDGNWILRDVVRSDPDTGASSEADRVTWPGAIESAVLQSLSVHPRDLRWTEVKLLAENLGYGNQPTYLYEVWTQKRIARPLGTVLLVLLAVASVQRLHPRQPAGLMLVAGIGIGFVYWIFDALVVTVGEAGLLPSIVAAWTAPLVLGALATAVILRQDGY
jgi:lipopolysaccharide export system permease protein